MLKTVFPLNVAFCYSIKIIASHSIYDNCTFVGVHIYVYSTLSTIMKNGKSPRASEPNHSRKLRALLTSSMPQSSPYSLLTSIKPCSRWNSYEHYRRLVFYKLVLIMQADYKILTNYNHLGFMWA